MWKKYTFFSNLVRETMYKFHGNRLSFAEDITKNILVSVNFLDTL